MISGLDALMVRAFLDGKKFSTRRTNLSHWGKVRPGDLLVFKENYWRRSYWSRGEVVRGTSIATDVRYMATDQRPVARDPNEEFWEACGWLKLPRFAWRCFAIAGRVVEQPIADITDVGAELEGFESRAAFIAWWDARHHWSEEFRFAANPRVAVVSFTPITKDEYVDRAA